MRVENNLWNQDGILYLIVWRRKKHDSSTCNLGRNHWWLVAVPLLRSAQNGVLKFQATHFLPRCLRALGLHPSLNPFFNLLYTVLKCAIRPLPVARLRIALRDQLYLRHLEPPPRPASFLSCLCQFDLPDLLLIVWLLLLRLPCAWVPAPYRKRRGELVTNHLPYLFSS